MTIQACNSADIGSWGVILFSHGSLLSGSGAPLDAHADRLRRRMGFAAVEVGYLNYSTPDVSVAIERMAMAGIEHIVIVPYFLVPGYFVTSALPRKLAEAARHYPQIDFVVSQCLGVHDLVADALMDVATDNKPVGDSDALIVIVHGSPNADANQEARQIVDLVRARGRYPMVNIGFLECCEPSIPEAIGTCIAQGATRITSLPCFLHIGTHVAFDLPAFIEQAQAASPHVEFLLTEHLGASTRITELLAIRAMEALARSTST